MLLLKPSKRIENILPLNWIETIVKYIIKMQNTVAVVYNMVFVKCNLKTPKNICYDMEPLE